MSASTTVVGILVIVALVLNVIICVIVTSTPLATNGIKCWDKNHNGHCDPKYEDIDKNGVCNYFDCLGNPGVDGVSGGNGTVCWDLNSNFICDLLTEDKDNDGNCTLDDCYVLYHGDKCFNSTAYPDGNITLCKGEDFVINTTASIYCWDTNSNSVGDPGEDTNNDGFYNRLDCDALDGDKCWDANGNGICDGSEDIDGITGCSIEDCVGARGEDGDNCWDLNNNKFCDFAEAFLGNGDGLCNSDDCITYPCWDLNQNQICDPAEDVDSDSFCFVETDCNILHLPYAGTYLNIGDTLLYRRETGLLSYTQQINATDVRVTGELTFTPHVFGTAFTVPDDIIYTENILLIPNATDITFASATSSVIINDSVVILLSLVSTDIKPLTEPNITLTATNIISPSSFKLDNISYDGSDFVISAGVQFVHFTQSFKADAFSSFEGDALSLFSSVSMNDSVYLSNGYQLDIASISCAGNTNHTKVRINSTSYFINSTTNYISPQIITSYKRVEGFDLTDLSIYANYIDFFTTGVTTNTMYINTGIENEAGTSYPHVNITKTATITSSTSDLVFYANPTIDVNTTIYTDQLASLHTNLQFTTVTIGDILETDSIDGYTVGTSPTFSTGLLLSNTESGYVPYNLNFYEVLDVDTTMSGIWSVSIPIRLRYERIGPIVSISCKADSRFTATTQSIISVGATLPARFRPSTSSLLTGITVFNNDTASYIGALFVSTSGFMAIQASHVTADRQFTALNHQNGVSVFSVNYYI
jgi:hypothetical protein